MQICTPPTTFDIYMQSSQQWNPNRSNISPPAPINITNANFNPALNKSTASQAFNLKNPLAELSLRDALNSSYSNYWTS